MRLARLSDTPGEDCLDGQITETVQRAHTGNHQSQPGCFDILHAARARAIRGRLDELLRYKPGLSHYPGTGPMATASCAYVLLEAVETRTQTAAATHPVGHPPG